MIVKLEIKLFSIKKPLNGKYNILHLNAINNNHAI